MNSGGSPHRDLRAHDLFDVFYEARALAAFGAKRVDHDVILLAVDFKRVLCPVRRDLGGRIDEHVPVWKLPLRLARVVHPAVDDLPVRRRLDCEFHGNGFVARHVHEDRRPVEVCMSFVEL